MAKKNKKGLINRLETEIFHGVTLVEILTAGIILGLIVIVTAPAITKFLRNYRNNVFATTIHGFIDATTYKVNFQEYSLMNKDITYYIPTKCISLEKGGESPFGEFEESYVVVTYNGDTYDYYYTGRDEKNNGVVLTYSELLKSTSVTDKLKEIDLSVGVGERTGIILFNTSCDTDDFVETYATKNIEEHGSLKDGVIENKEY